MAGLWYRLWGRRRRIPGGVFLPAWGGSRSTSEAIDLATPSVLTVPLRQNEWPAATLAVRVGDFLEAGQLIGTAQVPGAVHVHAPVAGRVTDIVQVDTARHADVSAVRIETAAARLEPSADRPAKADPAADAAWPGLESIAAAAEAAGLTDAQPQAGSLADMLRAASQRRIRHLIVNLLPGEPLTASGIAREGRHAAASMVRWAGYLRTALAARRVWVAVDGADRAQLRHLREAARGTPVRIAGLPNKYPQHAPVMRALTVVGIETPPGASTLDAGVAVLEAEALSNLAAVLGRCPEKPTPWTHRVVTVAGPPVLRPGRYRIPFGTRFADLLLQIGLRRTPKRVIDGGPLTGRAVADLEMVTTKQTAALLVLDGTNDRVPTPGPCVRCGRCQEDCPVGLDPVQMLNFAELGELQAAARFYPQACIDCGVCSYACPAELPLAAGVAAIKRAIADGGSAAA